MDGIQSLALSTYKHQTFHQPYPNQLYDCLEIVLDGNAGATPSRRPEFDLARWLGSNRAKSDANLKVLCIDREHDVSLWISMGCFYNVFDAMRADPAVTYLISQDYDGFHEFHEGNYLLTRFIGTPIYALFWTFDPATLATKAVFIQRRWAPSDEFKSVLIAHRNHIASSWMPGFVSCHMLLRWSDRETEKAEHQTLWNIEISTGFGPDVPGNVKWKIKMGELTFNINTLNEWSQAVNEAAGSLTNKIRHQKISKAVLELIAQEHKAILSANKGGAELSEEALTQLGRAVPVLQRQLKTFLDYLAYLHDRAERLSDVLFALLTHEDAGTSATIAAISQQDGSAMKTIAIMTMAFLPATFFAALFAIPSLRWDQKDVIQENFWVYWAFTLPSTAAVFLIWLIINKPRPWMTRVSHSLPGLLKPFRGRRTSPLRKGSRPRTPSLGIISGPPSQRS